MLKSYFTFTKNQSRAVVLLICTILTSMLLYFLMPHLYLKKQNTPSDDLQKLIEQISFHKESNYGTKPYSDTAWTKTLLTPFPFDPNTLDSAGFIKLGLREKLVRTLLNYRRKGGKFYNRESFRKIYGLQETEYLQLSPYIAIEDKKEKGKEWNSEHKQILIELNSADTSELIKLRGIGSKLSMNIVKYRKQLGGFSHIEQLKEVYGISSETYELIKPFLKINTSFIRKINLNEALYNELMQHPYLRGEIAKSLVEFRKKRNYHIENIDQLKEIELINEEIFRKIAPYLTLN